MQTRNDSTQPLQTQGMFSQTNTPATTTSQPVQKDSTQHQESSNPIVYDGAKQTETKIPFSTYR